MKHSNRSRHTIIKELATYISGGANSPGRKFSEVTTPIIIADKASGSYIWDSEGTRYVDFIMGLGPCLLGHSPDCVVDAIKEQASRGLVLGLTHRSEAELSKIIVNSSKHIDKVRFTCSGTEAVMTALRIARGITQKQIVVKFSGGYHGHCDTILSGANKKEISDNFGTDGIHSSFKNATITCRYNDIEQIKSIFSQYSDEIAAVIIEPVATNMGLVPAQIEFLKTLRVLCSKQNSLLIFDEVVSGYRFGFGPVSNELGIYPDLTTFGKIIGGGLAIGAYGGSDSVMAQVSNEGGVFQGGTFAGNPLTMTAGISTLRSLEDGSVYEGLDAITDVFTRELSYKFKEYGINFNVVKKGPLVSLILVESLTNLTSLDDVQKQDQTIFSSLHQKLCEQGYLIPPTIEEPLFFCSQHTEQQILELAQLIAFHLNTICHE
ncbi:aspartate aminotransferase family protein [Vibrio sp. 10N.222.55.C6]|uniref:aspartate aminotransferase family protein n=1 Tax=Vibrio sp. 10N.222.55.C6 TaxID=3229649 RepID=UPI0035529A76